VEGTIIKNNALSRGLICGLAIFVIGTNSIPLLTNVEKNHLNYFSNHLLLFESFGDEKPAILSINTSPPMADTFISENFPEGNMGSLAWLRVEGYTGLKMYTLLFFNISMIPPNVIINSATVHLFYLNEPEEGNPAGHTLELHPILKKWSEETVTWDTQPTHEQTATSFSIVPDSPYVWMTWNATNDVQSFVNGEKTNFGWKIIDIANSSDTPYFYSKEYNSSIPYLEIEYSIPEKNNPPTAKAGGPYSGYVDYEIIFNGSGSSDSDGSITGYRWDWNNDGIYDTGWSTSSIITNAYSSSGTYTVKLQVKDNDDALGNSTAIVTVKVLNNKQPPKADAGGPYQGNTNVSIRFNGSGSLDTDGTLILFLWDFGDGNTQPGISPSHTYTTAGRYTVTLTVTDNDNITNSDTTTATINSSKTAVLVITCNTSNTEIFEDNNSKMITLTIFCYNDSVDNVHLEVLSSSNLTITQHSSNINITSGEQKNMIVNIKTPKLGKGMKMMNETVLLHVVGDKGVASNIEQIHIHVIQRSTPGFELVLILFSVIIGLLFWRKKRTA
jgi:PKD repeat protein